eukprot:INCI17537.4.p1 GENE.INCI17537.4~~INCI17537.4.p1  ORF type:complete len:311 (-),score=62.27 INCI17537.4:317-1249(-)
MGMLFSSSCARHVNLMRFKSAYMDGTHVCFVNICVRHWCTPLLRWVLRQEAEAKALEYSDERAAHAKAVKEMARKQAAAANAAQSRQRKLAEEHQRREGVGADGVALAKRKLEAACIGRFRGDWGRLFRHADRDHSGALDMDEFRVSLRKLGKVPASQLGDDEVALLFKAVDAGANGRIEAGEFAEFMGLTPSDPKGALEAQHGILAPVTGESHSTLHPREALGTQSGQLRPVKSLKLEEGREVLHGVLTAPQAGFFEVSSPCPAKLLRTCTIMQRAVLVSIAPLIARRKNSESIASWEQQLLSTLLPIQ